MMLYLRLVALVVIVKVVTTRSVSFVKPDLKANPVLKDHNGNIQDFKRALLDNPDTSITDKIVLINQESGKNGLFEGDIDLTDHDRVDMSSFGDIDGPIKTNVKRNAQRTRQGLWITRVVPYEIDGNAITGNNLDTLKNAIQDFNKHSCLQWIPKTNSTDKNWVKFVKGDGCFSSVGRKYWIQGPQNLSLGTGCYSSGTIQHEMLHASGFWHEQSRPDRNQYVKVMWENIDKENKHNFNKYSHGSIDTLNKNYDYGSLMHYGKYGFSNNGQPTLLPLDPNQNIGQRIGLSQTDKLELNALYDCKTPSGGWSNWAEFSPCDSQCYKFRQRFCTAEDRTKVCPEANLYGIQTEYLKCSQQQCNVPIDGHWGRWSSWGQCSKTCGKGTQVRTRVCDDPAPAHGGAQCVGSNTGTQECQRPSCSLGPDDCDFEAGFCFWSQNTTDTSPNPWMQNSGATASEGTGPVGDHTSGSGKYIYSEASAPAEPGNTARIISKTFPSTSGRCMTFWYNMYGDIDMGNLNVYIENVDSKTSEKVWSISGNQGKEWKSFSLSIDEQSSYKIIFESVRGNSYRSDIALDDVMFKDGECQGQKPPIVAVTTQAPTTSPAADFCDFGTQENMYCTWYNDPNNVKTPDNYYQFNWWTHQGASPTSSTGPATGHGGSGYYAYIEASSPYQPNMKARLLSKQYQASSSMCFDFWYFMYGSGVGTLNVGLENTAGYKTMWTQSGNKGENWLHAKVPLSSTSSFKIVIEGTRGSSYLGDIAIDDLRVTQGPCT